MNRISKKVRIGIVLMLLLVSSLIGVLLLTDGWRGAPMIADFTGYKSTEPLNGASVKSTKLVRIKERGLDIWRFDYVQEYDSGVIMYERKIGGYDNPISCKGRPASDTIACVEGTIKDDGNYVVTTTKQEENLSWITVEGRIGTTELYVSIPENQLDEYEHFTGWQEFFDSMSPISLAAMPYEKRVTQMGG